MVGVWEERAEPGLRPINGSAVAPMYGGGTGPYPEALGLGPLNLGLGDPDIITHAQWMCFSSDYNRRVLTRYGKE